MRKSASGLCDICDSQGTAENSGETDPGTVRQKGVLFRGKEVRELEAFNPATNGPIKDWQAGTQSVDLSVLCTVL